MAALSKRQVRAVGSISGNQPQVRAYDIVAAQVIDAGMAVVLSAGKITESASPIPAADTLAGVLLHDVSQGTPWYLGRATPNQEETGGTYGGTFMGSANLLGSVEGIGGHVVLANADNIFEIGCVNALALSLVGTQVQVNKTGQIWEADNTGATKSALIVGIPNYPGQSIGDTNARVWVVFLAAASAIY